MDENELNRLLANLDFSRESKVRDTLRASLKTRTARIQFWIRGFPYWAGSVVILLIAVTWLFNLQIPDSMPGTVLQATAFASTGFSSKSVSHSIATTLPVVPKPIPTPQSVLMPAQLMQATTPFLTVSPYETPSITQKAGYH